MRLAELEVSSEDRVVIARVIGEIDMSNAEELRTAVSAAIPTDALAVVFDLTDVEYLDSAGIRLLYRLSEDLQTRRQRLQVVVPSSSRVADVLRLAGVSGYIGAVETVDDALGLLRSG
jgi:anti-anti-sigma factor